MIVQSCQILRKRFGLLHISIYPDEKIDNFDYEENENKFLKIIENNEIDLYIVEINENLIGYMSCGMLIRKFKAYG